MTQVQSTRAGGGLRTGLRALAAISFALIAAFAPAGCKDKEGERIEQTMTTLSNANGARDADTVISLLTERTVDHYTGIITLARTAPKDKLLREGATTVFQVLKLRLNFSEPQLRKLTAREYIRDRVKNGKWTFLFDDEDLTVGTPVVSGDTAQVSVSEPVQTRTRSGFRRRGGLARALLSQSSSSVCQIEFVRDDDGVWRLDEGSMVDAVDRLTEEILANSNLTVEGFLNHILTDDEGKPAPLTMWNPPKTGASAVRPDRD